MESKVFYKHCDIDDSFISLHDYYANKIIVEDSMISFYFENGFWITPDHKYNNLNNTVGTDSSMVNFYFEKEYADEILIYVFRKNIFRNTIREEWNLQKLTDFINNKRFRLEILYQYKGYNELIFDCWLHTDKKPYFYECQLKIPTTKATYCWNNLCEDQK